MPNPSLHAPDPGSPLSRRLALIGAVLVSAVVIGMQNIPPLVDYFSSTQPAETEEDKAPEVRPPQPGDMFNTMGRLYVKLADLVAGDAAAERTLDRFATSPADRLRAAVVIAEIDDAGADVERPATERLRALGEDLDHPVAADARALLRLYESPDRTELDQETVERLKRRHGFYAEIALTHHLPEGAPEREEPRRGGAAMITVLTGMLLVGGVALLAGLVLFIVAIVLLATGRLRARFPRPAPGGSVFLEVYALFVAGFIALQLLAALLAFAFKDAPWLGAVRYGAQWLLLLVLLWPLARGMSPRRLAGTIGWHKGAGVFKEIGFGILGYLAGLPVYLAGAALTLLLIILAEIVRAQFVSGPPPVPENDIMKILDTAPPLQVALLVALATIWAPLCEESVFRGALFRHFRARHAVPIAALASAALFGFMHGYGPLFVFPLIALGVVFALMREWRGSLIAPITAHMLHNATVTVLLIVILRYVA